MHNALQSMLFTQVSLRRNYQDLKFCPQDDEGDLQESRRRTLHRLSHLENSFDTILPQADQKVYAHFQKSGDLPAHFGKMKNAALAVNLENSLMISINLEEHLVVSSKGRNGHVEEQVQAASAVLQALTNQEHPFAIHERFGFLSYRPELSGSGLYVSYILHLPMMSFLKQVQRAMGDNHLLKDCQLKPYLTRENRNPAKLFVLTNARSHGLSEEELLAQVTQAARFLDDQESLLRQKAFHGNGDSILSDQIWRAYGVLKYARRLDEVDFLQLWSSLRLGEVAGVLPLEKGSSDRMLDLAFEVSLGLDPAEKKNTAIMRAERVRQELHGG